MEAPRHFGVLLRYLHFRTFKDLLCNCIALLPLLIQHYTSMPVHQVFWMSIHQHTSAGHLLCWTCHFGIPVSLSELPHGPSMNLSPLPCAQLLMCPDSLDHRSGCFPLSHPVVKFYTATLIPAAEYMSCDTSVVQCPPELHSHPEMIKFKTTLAE